MADCKYCGKKAGIFSNTHKECEEKQKGKFTMSHSLYNRINDLAKMIC